MKIFRKNDVCEYDGAQIVCSDMLLAECRQYIKSKLTRRELLEQLAEECNELSKVTLKTIRAEGLSNNPTPINREETTKNFTEEQLDVIAALYLLTDNKMYEYIRYYPKYVRWAMRLGYQIPAEYTIKVREIDTEAEK